MQSNSTSSLNSTSNRKSPPTLAQFLVKEQTLNKDFSLSLLLNNIPANNESFLRENLAKRVEKGTLYASSSNISSFNLGLVIESLKKIVMVVINLFLAWLDKNNLHQQFLKPLTSTLEDPRS